MTFDAESLFYFLNVLRYNHATILTHRCEVYVTVVEELSGIDVDDVLQLRTKKQLLFFDTILHNYVVDLGLPSTLVVAHET